MLSPRNTTRLPASVSTSCAVARDGPSMRTMSALADCTMLLPLGLRPRSGLIQAAGGTVPSGALLRSRRYGTVSSRLLPFGVRRDRQRYEVALQDHPLMECGFQLLLHRFDGR